LLECYRQPAQLFSNLLSSFLIQTWNPGPEQLQCIRKPDHIQIHHLAQGSETASPSSDNYMTGYPCRHRATRQPLLNVLDFIRVIKDQQPPRHSEQPIVDLSLQCLLIRGRINIKLHRQGAELAR